MQSIFGYLHPENYQIPQSNSPSSILDGLRVLVVDNDADQLKLVEIIFELYQAQVQTAASVAEAIKVIEEWTPDILINDKRKPSKIQSYLLYMKSMSQALVG